MKQGKINDIYANVSYPRIKKTRFVGMTRIEC